MSSDVFPVLPGLAFDNTRTPRWSTKENVSVSGKRQAAEFWSYPVWKYKLTFEVLRSFVEFLELQTLVGFFLEQRGRSRNWLYRDPSDNAVTGQPIGFGNGVTTSFQLVRTYGANGNTFAEPMTAIDGDPVIKVGGVAQVLGTDFTVSDTGLVTFATAPASGSITADFSYLFRCHFLNDGFEVVQIADGFWEAQTVEFETIK